MNGADRIHARAALAAVRESDRRLAAQAARCPPWRHALFGALMGALIASAAISLRAQFIAMPFLLLAVVLIVRGDRRRYGMFVNGYRRGATLPITLAMIVVMAVELAVALHLREAGYPLYVRLSLGLLAFAIACLFSVIWNRRFHRELTQTRV